MKYTVTYTVEDEDFEVLLKKVFASLYLAEIDGHSVRIAEDGFEFPATAKLVRHLNETPPAEGDWQLKGEGKVGEDTE